MKHIKHILERGDWWDSDPSAPWNQEPDQDPQSDKEMSESENLFKCLAFNSSFAVLSKKGVRNELWLVALEAVDGMPELDDYRGWIWTGSRYSEEKEYLDIDESCIEWFTTAVYRGDYKNVKWLNPKEAVCEDPNRSLTAYEEGPEFIIRISGALAQALIRSFTEDYHNPRMRERQNLDYRAKLSDMIDVISRVYPEGRLLPGEKPQEDPET